MEFFGIGCDVCDLVWGRGVDVLLRGGSVDWWCYFWFYIVWIGIRNIEWLGFVGVVGYCWYLGVYVF